jgi:endonuclease-3
MAEDEIRALQILQILKKTYSVPQISERSRDPFQALIRTVLSQNTADVNTFRAFQSLSRLFPITPKALAEADIKEVEGAIRVAGLYKNKSRVIRNLSRLILERFRGSLDFIYVMPFEEARKILMGLPGVGPKTADVVLLFCTGAPTLPVDTHVNRVSKRLGLVSKEADYEGVRKALQEVYPPEDFLSVHLLFIAHGRRYCKAPKPVCEPCPINHPCPYFQFPKLATSIKV